MGTEIFHNRMRLVFDKIYGSWGMSRMAVGGEGEGGMPVPCFHIALAEADYGGHSNIIAGESVIPLQAGCTGLTREGDTLSMAYDIAGYGLEVTVTMELIPGADMIRQTNRVKNTGDRPRTLTHFSSMCAMGIAGGGLKKWYDSDKIKIHYCYNIWEGEGQWRCAAPEELGMYPCSVHQNTGAVQFRSVGSWSTGRYFPKAMIEDTECGEIWYFEIETGGSWHYEIGHRKLRDGLEGGLYMLAGAADENQLGWHLTLQPGEEYKTVPVSFGCTAGGFDEAVREQVRYKRRFLRPQPAWKGEIPVVFNDYMNALWGNPTTERLVPLIDAAAEAGSEVFCIDAGWFAPKEKNWGAGIGDWNSSADRFGEGGVASVLDYIKSKGMLPGLWLEMEACQSLSGAYGFDDSFFLCHHGSRLGGGRAFFDYRNGAVREYMHKKIDDLYGIGVRYIKNDYNQSTGAGADAETLARHTRAFYDFIDEVRARHPDLIIENCGSGALREDSATLSRFHLQSTSDQEIYHKYPSIISGTLANVLPEQAGIWSYPYPVLFMDMLGPGDAVLNERSFAEKMADGEQTIFNMVNGMCGVLYLSGRIEACDEYNMSLIKEGVALYKSLRPHIRSSYPIWPCGRLRINDDTFGSVGLISESGDTITLAVWRLATNRDTVNINLSRWINVDASAGIIYPAKSTGVDYVYNRSNRTLSVRFSKNYSARLFRITVK